MMEIQRFVIIKHMRAQAILRYSKHVLQRSLTRTESFVGAKRELLISSSLD